MRSDYEATWRTNQGEEGAMTLPIKPAAILKRSRSPRARLFGSGELTRSTRCAIVVAHPGDEIVGAGCLLSKLVEVKVLHVTDGVAFETENANGSAAAERCVHAKALREECMAALAIAGVPADRVFDLLIPNRRAAFCLFELTKRIASFLQQSGADIVITHPYEGSHPDHDATAFATHAAVRLIRENGFKPPVLFEMALHPDVARQTRVTQFLPGAEEETTTLVLDKRARKLKEQMFVALETEPDVSSSPIGSEKFRRPPEYDFLLPPQPDELYYADLGWAPHGDEWQALAAKALAELFSANGAALKYELGFATQRPVK
jgi:N-acetylglucosamine malate deacetylase 2